MKNTNRLLAVLLAFTIAVSGIVITTMTTNAIDVTVDNTKDVIATVKGSDIAGDGDGGNATAYSRDEAAGTFSFNGDCGNFYGIYLKGVEAGVYKVAYYMTLENVSGNDRIRFKPYGADVYYNVAYDTLRQYEGMKVMVVAVINATGDFEVGGWPNTGLYGTIDKVEIAKADYDFGANAGEYILIEEGIAHDIPGGYTQPADEQWTKSTSNKPSTTQVLNTQAWSYDFNEENYKALFGDGAHGTNGDTVKATVAAGTGLTEIECPATAAPSMNLNTDGYVVKYTGVIEAAESGWYQLAAYKIDNGYVAYVGGEKVFDYGKWNNWFDSNRLMYCGDNFYMEAGVKYSYEAYYIEQGGGDAIEPMILVDGKNRSFAAAGISFYADIAADDATVTIDNSAPALEATDDDVLFYQNFEGVSITDDSQAVNIGVDIISGKTDVTIEAVVRPLNIRSDGGLMTNNSGLIGIGEQDNTDKYILLGFMEGGALKVAVKASSDANVERQTAMGQLNNNKWVTLKYVFTADSVKTYADDILVCENDISGVATIGDFTGKFLIGDITSWPDAGFRGQVGEIRVTSPKEESEQPEDPVYPEINPYAEVKFGDAVTDYDKEGTTYDGDHLELKVGESNANDPNYGGIGTTYSGAWMEYKNVQFGDKGAANVTITYGSRASRMAEDAAAQIWIGGKSEAEGGTLVGTVALPVPEGEDTGYVYGLTATADLDAVVTGTQDVYVVLTGTTDVNENEYIANLNNFVFAEAEEGEPIVPDEPTYPGDDGEEDGGDEGEGDGEQTPSIPTLGETDKDVLFYTDFSDISNLIVKEAGKASADAAASQITLDADGNMVMTRDQYIDLDATLLDGKTNVTIEFVVKPDAIVNHAAFAGLGVGDDTGWMVLGMQSGGAIKFGMKSNDIEIGGNDSGKSEGGLLVVGEWVTIRYEITESSVTMFVNDVAVKNPAGTEVMSFDLTGQKTLSELANLEGAQFAFGKETKWGDAGFTGTVSEIRVTTTAAEDGDGEGSGDGSTDKPITGDVASVVAILAAGAAALGGLKLRKKSK